MSPRGVRRVCWVPQPGHRMLSPSCARLPRRRSVSQGRGCTRHAPRRRQVAVPNRAALGSVVVLVLAGGIAPQREGLLRFRGSCPCPARAIAARGGPRPSRCQPEQGGTRPGTRPAQGAWAAGPPGHARRRGRSTLGEGRSCQRAGPKPAAPGRGPPLGDRGTFGHRPPERNRKGQNPCRK